MNRQNYTNYERNIAMMVIYVPVKFEYDWTKRFRVKSPETKNVDEHATCLKTGNLQFLRLGHTLFTKTGNSQFPCLGCTLFTKR